MELITDAQANLLSNVIRVAWNINTIAIDGIDGYATLEQIKQELNKCADEIKFLIIKMEA